MDFPKKLDEEDFDLAVKEWKLAGYEIERGSVHAYIQYPLSQKTAQVVACYLRTEDGYTLVPWEPQPACRISPGGELL